MAVNDPETSRFAEYILSLGTASFVFGAKGISRTPVFCIYDGRLGTQHERSELDSYQHIIPVHEDLSVSGRHRRSDGIDIGCIQDWLNICDEHHAQCRGGLDHSVHDLISGLHVIDCHSRTVTNYSSATQKYATLSYVWGSQNPEIESFQKQLPTVLPKVVEDAVLLVQKLGIWCLWVDRYCVPQDDPRIRHLQIQNMGKIYGNSTLTIVGAAGADPHYGLPGVSSTQRKLQPAIRIRNFCLIGYCEPRTEIGGSSWNWRAWTYKEAILSKRRLVCTETQVHFECLGLHCNDSLSMPLRALHSPRGLFFPGVNFGKAFASSDDLRDPRTILHRINEYRHRNLSFDNDALEAVAGIFVIYSNLELSPISVRPSHLRQGGVES
jgi:hypothetical protein